MPGEAVVLDASITLAWCFEDELDPYADAVQDALGEGAYGHVAAIWPMEVANAFRMSEKRRRTSEADSARFIALLRPMSLAIDPVDWPRIHHSVLPLARLHNLTVYDAAYLELAIRLGLPVATLDQALRDAASAAGVPLLVI